MMIFSTNSHAHNIPIVTIDSALQEILHQKTEEIQEEELFLAREIAEKLFCALQPHFPAAGLAAPQIGISKSVFIFSFDRDPKNLEVVINPSFSPLEDLQIEGWEGCFSVMLSNGIWKLAKVPRYEVIRVQYRNLKWELVEKTLDGFAAKVFQHECDHLQGITNIERKDALVRAFDTKEEMLLFMSQVKKEDALRYKKPSKLF